MNVHTLVCFALKEEAAPFRRLVAGQSDPRVLVVGIGRQNAERSIRNCLNDQRPARPQWVLTAGFAGGLDPALKIGDVRFETDDDRLRSRLSAAGARPAVFFCGDRIATTVAEKEKLRRETGADAVEMESAAIQAVCREHAIPCATVRVISDTAGEDLPLDFNALAKPDKSLDFGKLAWAIACAPGKIGALMELQKKTSFAARQLAQVIGAVCELPNGG